MEKYTGTFCNGAKCSNYSGAKKITCWGDCNGGGGGNHGCKWDSYYYKFKTTYRAGDDVYVRVEPRYGKQNIEYMTLYIDGIKIRTEKQYVYEWGGKGKNDHHLNNMRRGNYKLKCVIRDRCGKNHEIYQTIRVQ